MLTKEFVKEVRTMGLDAAESERSISIYAGFGQAAYINKYRIFCVNTDYDSFYNLSEELQAKLYYLMDEYARTPLDEREKTVKFFLRFKGDKLGINNYLNYSVTLDWLVIREKMDSENFKTQFTQKEIDEIREKFKVTLCDFEQIPVKEDEKKEWSEEEW